MAKKTISGLKKRDTHFTKIVRMVKSAKGSYIFKEKIISAQQANDYFNNGKITKK